MNRKHVERAMKTAGDPVSAELLRAFACLFALGSVLLLALGAAAAYKASSDPNAATPLMIALAPGGFLGAFLALFCAALLAAIARISTNLAATRTLLAVIARDISQGRDRPEDPRREPVLSAPRAPAPAPTPTAPARRDDAPSDPAPAAADAGESAPAAGTARPTADDPA